MNDRKIVTRFIKFMLDLADYIDENGDDEKINKSGWMQYIGLGERSFTAYIRKAISEIVKTRDSLEKAKRNTDYLKGINEEYKNFLKDIGISTWCLEEYEQEDIKKIKEFIEKEFPEK